LFARFNPYDPLFAAMQITADRFEELWQQSGT
jgi:hypothetical protein